MAKNLGAEHRLTQRLVEAMIDACNGLQRPDEAAIWKRRLAEK